MDKSEFRVRALGMGLREREVNKSLLPENDDYEENVALCEIDSTEQSALKGLYEYRDNLLLEHAKVFKKLEELSLREKELLLDINLSSRNICLLEGHRLDEDSYYLTKALGFGYNCLVCRRFIPEEDICSEDIFITKNSDYKRSLKKRTI